jgi:hypothetical protein
LVSVHGVSLRYFLELRQLHVEIRPVHNGGLTRTVNPLGVKGIGERGIIGAAAAVASAVFHATGKRLRGQPITLDKVLTA